MAAGDLELGHVRALEICLACLLEIVLAIDALNNWSTNLYWWCMYTGVTFGSTGLHSFMNFLE